MEQDAERMAETVIQWANINTGSFNVPGQERMAAVLTQAFSALECEGDVLSIPPIEHIDEAGRNHSVDLGPLLRFWKRPHAPIQVLLVGHMDTVFDLENPFQTAHRTSPNIIQGPGVTDMKGGLCVMLEGLLAFEKTREAASLGWEVLINPDEEMGSIGSGPYLAGRAKFHQVGLLFEPAMDEAGTLAGERKGSGKFTLVVQGRAAHAGRDFHQGRNAITALAHIVSAIDALNGQQEGVTLNIGQIRGGGAVNVVPALAVCRVDVRIQNVQDETWVLEKFNTILHAAQKQEGIKVTLTGGFNRKPKLLTGKTRALFELVAEVAKEIGEPLSWKQSGGCCDGNNLAEVGLPNVDTLGVCGGKIHSEEEYLLVDSLPKRAKLTTAILTRLVEKPLD